MEYKGKKYCVFPNYMLKFDGSVQAVEGSAMENFIRLRGINENRKYDFIALLKFKIIFYNF